jgi:mono/diheme cytochrome c family protein
MKLKTPIFILAAALLLTACSFSLAQDVTPPPNYISPTPPPTLGPLYPPEPVSMERGASIYAEKCAACHGDAGMGDGQQGKGLPLPVAALALPQFYRAASPAEWFTIVTRGNIERFMPPFGGASEMGEGLTEQQRWDVVAYAQSLHATAESLAQGRTLFETNCADCPLAFFQDRAAMAALSADDLATLLKTGGENVTAISNLTNEELYLVADYLRTLAYSVPTPTPEPATVTPTIAAPEATPTAAPTESTTPSTDTTPAAQASPTPNPNETPVSTETSLTPVATESVTATPSVPTGAISGAINGDKVGGLTVTLHGFDHSESAGPEEKLTLTAVTAADGSYVFENVELPEGRILLLDVVYQTVTYQTEMTIVEKDKTEITLPALKVYPALDDFTGLTFEDVRFFLTVTDQAVQVVGVYTVYNRGAEAITVESSVDVPFLVIPNNSMDSGFDLTQDSAPLLATETGFAIPPSEAPYGFVAYYTLPYPNKIQIAQPFILDATVIGVLIPEGVKVKSDQITEVGLQAFQEANYTEYSVSGLKAGDTLSFELSGKPKTSLISNSPDSKKNLLIGVGALGLALILVGVWLYLRDRNRVSDEDETEETDDEFESREELLDAIIALDDLRRAGKIEEDSYQKRRAELKERLKNL